jgi:hypothetical protein
MTQPITFPIRAFCNKNARRNVTITIIGGLIIAVSEGLKMRHCGDCSPFSLAFIQLAFLSAPFFIALLLIKDKPAIITINPSSVEIQTIRIFGFGRLSPSTKVSLARFRYLTFKPVLGGAAIATPFSPFAIGGGNAIRLVLRGKPGVTDVIFDLPADLEVEPLGESMPIFTDYLKRLGSSLNLETRDEVWGERYVKK